MTNVIDITDRLPRRPADPRPLIQPRDITEAVHAHTVAVSQCVELLLQYEATRSGETWRRYREALAEQDRLYRECCRYLRATASPELIEKFRPDDGGAA